MKRNEYINHISSILWLIKTTCTYWSGGCSDTPMQKMHSTMMKASCNAAHRKFSFCMAADLNGDREVLKWGQKYTQATVFHYWKRFFFLYFFVSFSQKSFKLRRQRDQMNLTEWNHIKNGIMRFFFLTIFMSIWIETILGVIAVLNYKYNLIYLKYSLIITFRETTGFLPHGWGWLVSVGSSAFGWPWSG